MASTSGPTIDLTRSSLEETETRGVGSRHPCSTWMPSDTFSLTLLIATLAAPRGQMSFVSDSLQDLDLTSSTPVLTPVLTPVSDPLENDCTRCRGVA